MITRQNGSLVLSSAALRCLESLRIAVPQAAGEELRAWAETLHKAAAPGAAKALMATIVLEIVTAGRAVAAPTTLQ